MKFKQIGVAAAILGLTSIGVVATAGSASAHTPSFSHSCDGVTASGSGYEAADSNALSVKIDSNATVVKTFLTSGSLTVPVPQDGKVHTYLAGVHTTNPNPAYSKSESGSVGPCGQVKPEKPPVTKEKRDKKDDADCTKDTVTTEHQERTHDWTYNQDKNKWEPKDSEWVTTSKTEHEASDEDCADHVDKPKVTTTETKTEGKPDCMSKTVEITTVTTKHDWKFNEDTDKWEAKDSSKETKTTRPVTEKECPAVVTPPVEKPPVVTPPVTPPAAAPVVPVAKVVAVPGSGAPHTGDSLPQTGSADATLLLAGLLAMSMGFFGIAASRLMRRKA